MERSTCSPRAPLCFGRCRAGVKECAEISIASRRLDQQLTLNEDWRAWTSYDLLSDVTLPYELRPLPCSIRSRRAATRSRRESR
jgi:hypothetical protein